MDLSCCIYSSEKPHWEQLQLIAKWPFFPPKGGQSIDFFHFLYASLASLVSLPVFIEWNFKNYIHQEMCMPGKCMQKAVYCAMFLFFLNITEGWGKNRKNHHACIFEVFQGWTPWVLVYIRWLFSNLEFSENSWIKTLVVCTSNSVLWCLWKTVLFWSLCSPCL